MECQKDRNGKDFYIRPSILKCQLSSQVAPDNDEYKYSTRGVRLTKICAVRIENVLVLEEMINALRAR